MRKKLREILETETGIDVVAAVRGCGEALPLMREFLPDLLVTDMRLSCPNERAGLCAEARESGCPALVTGPAECEEEALREFRSLRRSGFAFAALPRDALELNERRERDAFAQRIKSALATLTRKSSAHDQEPRAENTAKNVSPVRNAVALGISTGGPRTIMRVLPRLPADLEAPVFLVQHMPPEFTAPFAQRLNEACALTVREARDNEEARNGTVYLAPGNRHLTVRRAASGAVFCRLTDAPRTLFMPSVNVMMNSVLDVFGPRTIGVLMTGMGSDGAEAMARIRQSGGYTVAESKETCVVWGMPREAVERGGADIVLPCDRIADAVVKRLNAAKRESETDAAQRRLLSGPEPIFSQPASAKQG